MSGTRVVATWVSLAGAALAGVGLFAVLSWIAVAQAQPAGGTWGQRAPLPAANSETAVAQTEDKIYVLGGYPSDRVSVATVQIYDIATDTWEFGPPLPATNNHGMAAAVGGRVYAIGGQATAQGSYTDAVLELDPAVGDPAAGVWVPKAPMPTPRSGGVAIVADGKIYVAGGRPPRGNDFAVYDPALDQWTVLPDLPSQRNHIAGGLMGGKIYVVGGRLAGGFRSEATAVVEVFDPATNTWAAAAPLPRPRSGVNGVVAFGCLHVWGGEGAFGMFPDHDVYDPRSDTWTHLANMPIPIHGVTGAAFSGGLIYMAGGGLRTGGSSGSTLHQTYAPALRCE